MRRMSKWVLICSLVTGMTFGSLGMAQPASAASSAIDEQFAVHEQFKLEPVTLPTDGLTFSAEDNGYYERADSVVVTSSGDIIVLDRQQNRVLKFNNDGSFAEQLFDRDALHQAIRQLNESYPNYNYNQIVEITYFENNEIPYLYIIQSGYSNNDSTIYNLNTGTVERNIHNLPNYTRETSIGADDIAYQGYGAADYITFNPSTLSEIQGASVPFGKLDNVVHSLTRTPEDYYVLHTYNTYPENAADSQILVIDTLDKYKVYSASQSCSAVTECVYSSNGAGGYYSEVVTSPNHVYTASVTLSSGASYSPHAMIYKSLGAGDYEIAFIPIAGEFTHAQIANIAVDNDGNLYIQQADVPRVTKYVLAAGSYQASSIIGPAKKITPISDFYNFAISSSGDVYVLDRANYTLLRFTSTGHLEESISTNNNEQLVLYRNMVLLYDRSGSNIEVYDAITLDLIGAIPMVDEGNPDGETSYNGLYAVAAGDQAVIIAGRNGYEADNGDWVEYADYYKYELLYDGSTFVASQSGPLLEQAPDIIELYWDATLQSVKSFMYGNWEEGIPDKLYTYNIDESTVTPDDRITNIGNIEGRRLYQDQAGFLYDVDGRDLTVYNLAGLYLLDVNFNSNFQLTADGALLAGQYNSDAQTVTFEGYQLAEVNAAGVDPAMYELPVLSQVAADSITNFDADGEAIIDLGFDFPYATDEAVNQITVINNQVDDYIGVSYGEAGFVFLPFNNPYDVSYAEVNNDDRQQVVIQFSHTEATIQIIMDESGDLFVQTLDIFDDNYVYYATEYGGYAGLNDLTTEFLLPTSLFSTVKLDIAHDSGLASGPVAFQDIQLISAEPIMDVISITSPTYGSAYTLGGEEEQVVLEWEASALEMLAAEDGTDFSADYRDVLIISADPSFEYDRIYTYIALDAGQNTHRFTLSQLTPGLPYYFRVMEQHKIVIEDDWGTYNRYDTSALSDLGSFKVIAPAGTGGDNGGDPGDTGGGGDNGGNPGNGNAGGSGTGAVPNPGVESDPVVKVNGAEVRSTITNSGLSVQATDANSSNLEVNLNQAVWKELAEHAGGRIQISARGANYNLPIAALQVDAALSQLGLGPDDDYEIVISIQSRDNGRARQLAGQRNASVIGSSFEFSVTIVAKNEQTELNQFNSYVNREIELPEGTTPDQVSTAVVVEDSGLRHVPTKFVQNNGKWYASINSLTNSEYALIYAEVSFDDVTSHWAEGVIEEMGARQIVSGKQAGIFDPNANVTRAEFTAMLIRTLGLGERVYQGSFTDVSADRWYAGAVETAVSYELIAGYSDGTFRPNDPLTREQAMVMTKRAAKLVNLEGTVDGQELTGYKDADKLSSYAKESAAELVALGIMKGRRSSELAPQATITRAEVTQVLYNLLLTSAFVN